MCKALVRYGVNMCETCKELKQKEQSTRSFISQMRAGQDLIRHKLACHAPTKTNGYFEVTKKITRRLDLNTHKVITRSFYSCKKVDEGMVLLNTPWGSGNIWKIVVPGVDQQSAYEGAKKILESYV